MNGHNPPSGWPPSAGPGPPAALQEQQNTQQRPIHSFGPPILQQAPQHPVNGPPIIPQPNSFFSSQTNGHNLPAPPSMSSQASPLQPNRGPPLPPTQQHSPPSLPQPPPHYGLPALVAPQQSPQAALQIEREMRERENQEQFRQQQHIAQQRFEQELEIRRDMLARESHQLHSPRENHAATVPLQQPIANRVTGSLHGPNGILNEQHMTTPPHAQPAQPSGAPSGPGNVFGGNPQSLTEARAMTQQVNHEISTPQQQLQLQAQQLQQQPQHQLIHLTNAAAPNLVNGVTPLNNQQPILNDALSYLDQVKLRFQDHPDVYNRFLDIMKDFKSQAIDTPGVIDRVSHLFAGNPELIQGFNTFLPPGYRIECGLSDDPNAIRVTTPMGTTLSQMPSAPNRMLPNGLGNLDAPRVGLYPSSQQNGDWAARQQEIEQQEHAIVQGAVQRGGGTFGPQPPLVSVESAALEEQLQNEGQDLPPGLAASQHLLGNLEKRGPVEFNHAIGYVNKIKNRFASQPEIYKQFLEILQTYQRESRPIQDVYAQVTQLFNAAPDLLEDFKQFLPESAAQAKAQAQAAAARQQFEDAALANNPRSTTDLAHGTSAVRTQTQTPHPPEYKMPPLGTFAPPSVGKDNKKRRGGTTAQATASNIADTGLGSSNRNRNAVNASNKRQRIDQAKPPPGDTAPVSPTLVPALPVPIRPTKDDLNTTDGIAFFDRVRKFVGNRQVFNEFLKVCNLFNNEIIDVDALMLKAESYIGSNPELFGWLKRWIGYEPQDKYIENSARIPSGKVALSNCRGHGPSYRLLPKRERLRICSGRDEICKAVLNDTWVSHPTWASEESGFIAHRKNIYEEALHRIEEERHDYDINIEACTRTIQLLEPIAQSLLSCTKEEQAKYKLPPTIGGQSETIYQRVIKKIYDREQGAKVIEDLFRRPSAVIPVLLGRLRQKDQEWRASQREWEKVWRAQTNNIFWKSLDHQGINAKQQEKKTYQPKTLTNEIQSKYDEQRRQRLLPWSDVPRYQFRYEFRDADVIFDTCHLILTALHFNFPSNELDKSRLDTFLRTFIPTFFDMDRDIFEERMADIEDGSPANEDNDEENTDTESINTRGRRGGNTKKQDLRRGVLNPSKQPGEGGDESGVTTPDVQSLDEDTPASTGTPTEQPRADPSEHRWVTHPLSGNETADLNKPFKREDFHLYATNNIYCFFRVFQGLYERLLNVKNNEYRVREDVAQAKLQKPADELGLTDRPPTHFFSDTSDKANYYEQIFHMCEDIQRGEFDHQQFEETLRRFYMREGWSLYSFDRMLSALLRFALQILVSDNKDKSLDIINLFYKDRKEDETTHQNELTYRKQVEKLGKEGDIYRIRYNRPNQTTYLQVFKKDDRTYEADELAAAARWSYYVSTYCMFDRTEGVPVSNMRLPYLRRNLPFKTTKLIDSPGLTEDVAHLVPVIHDDKLVIRIAPHNYHILYDPHTSDWLLQSVATRKRGLGADEELKQQRKVGLQKLVDSREKLSEEETKIAKERFEAWIRDGPPGEGVKDTVMKDA